ncbi:helix-turn-helix domain-containing protein [Saccharopolyspora phatthalungensis]|uniref:DNA-binding transcriptional MerR regulator n=1 Tax=Saccharopolyspora phatthalungensis TaxID=664693 RepID=A0A840Q0K8_9PSEU|nr:helix-turn-helix domain-containing protein [Saccharopolyspora phatthalungensis]MBB5153510.1 DNA-binding transcriptional MerR regulator [Saccharopolyspora phatthalungensis]
MIRPRLLTSSQLADELGVSRRSVARYVQAGILVPELFTPGGQARFDLEDSKRQLREYTRKMRG